MDARLFLGINLIAALAVAAIQEYYVYWPHDSIGYILSGISALENGAPFVPSRANMWSLFAGPLASIHPFLVRVFGLFLFFSSAYVLYSLIRGRGDFAQIFFVLVTVPSYAVWVSAAGLSEPLAYLFFTLSFAFWIKYVGSKNWKYVLLSAMFAALLFIVRPPLAIVWLVPGIYVFAKDRALFVRAVLTFAATVFTYGLISLIAFGSFLPTLQYMVSATSSRLFNTSPLWYALCVFQPLLVFGVLLSPIVFVAYVLYARDDISFWLLVTLVPYALAMLFFAPKEPRYYTVFIYFSAYVLAKMLMSLFGKLPTLLYLAIAISSFFFISGVCVNVNYVPVRTWTIDFPCFTSPFVADAQVKLDFVRYLCSHLTEVGQQWKHVVYYMGRFYPSVCT